MKRYQQNFVFQTEQRLDSLLLPVQIVEKQKEPDSFTYITINLQNGQQMTEIKDVGIWLPTYSPNWNIREIGMTYYDKEKLILGRRGLYFKIAKSPRTNEFINLKHIARIVVLSSFNRNFLIQRNLPISLFEYLGIKK